MFRFFDLFWRGFLYLFPHSLRVHVAGKARAKLGWKAQFFVMPNAMIERRARFARGGIQTIEKPRWR